MDLFTRIWSTRVAEFDYSLWPTRRWWAGGVAVPSRRTAGSATCVEPRVLQS